MRLSCLKYIFYKNEYDSVNTNEEMVNKQYENIKNEGDLKTRPRSNRERDRLDLLEYDKKLNNNYWICTNGNQHPISQKFCRCLIEYCNKNPLK